MMMPTVMDDGVLVTEMPEKGVAYVAGGAIGKGREMSLQEAELYKENHIRSRFGLEQQGEMPLKRQSTVRICRRCRLSSRLRCSACRMTYCSRSCQRKDWKRHVFICAVRNRPNDFDRLGIILSRRSCMSRGEEARSKLLLDLFSDDHLCRAFGFVNCFDYQQIGSLLCIYGVIAQTPRFAINEAIRGGGDIGAFVEVWARVYQACNKDAPSDCHCIPWFLDRRATGFDIPNWDGQYLYQVLGLQDAHRAFSLRPAAEDSTPLSPAETAVLSLYWRLFRPFNSIPDVYSAEWATFGFCYCQNIDQRKSLAQAYLELAKNGASLGDVTHAWLTSSLSQLMKARGIDVSYLETNGINFRRPHVDEFGIYRLISEVCHALSGRYCNCFKPKDHCHPKHETSLSVESDGDYGFHGTNAWERWQLLNFYNHIFQHPIFDARKMQQARRDTDHDALDRYLESLIPNFRQKIWNMYLGDGMFPKLRARVQFPKGRPHCYCVVHDTMAPEGLDWRTPWRIQNSLTGRALERGEENAIGDSG
jgi:MYND finger